MLLCRPWAGVSFMWLWKVASALSPVSWSFTMICDVLRSSALVEAKPHPALFKVLLYRFLGSSKMRYYTSLLLDWIITVMDEVYLQLLL